MTTNHRRRARRLASETARKGQNALLAVAFDMNFRYDYAMSFPMEGEPFDLIASRGTEVLRVQVKTIRRRERDGKTWVVIDCTDGAGERYLPGEVDLFAAYDRKDGRVFYIRASDLGDRREVWISPANLYQL